LDRRPPVRALARALFATAALIAAVALSGCNTDGTLPLNERASRPLSEKMVAEIESKNMDKDSPILVRLFKEESELEVWKKDRTGHFALLKTYPICRWSGELGPKIKEGDRQAPEGFYTITPGQMNPNSAYYLSFDLGYPNAFDRAYGRTGSQLMVHGDCSSRGCYSMTDEQIAEIYALGRDAFFGGQRSFQVQAYPFRMTAKNFARHRTNPNMAFWKMLKQGNDHFEVTHLEPKVNVCEKRYVFDAENPADPSKPLSFNASGKCPAFEVPEEIANAVKEKDRKDEIQIAALSRSTPVAPIRTNADGGMNEVFVAAVKRNQIGVAPQEFVLGGKSAPGTIPAHVRPPRIPELADTSAGAAPTPPSGEVVSPQLAIADSQPVASGGSLFSNLFSSDKTADKAGDKTSGNPFDRMARLIGLRGSDTKTKPAGTTPTPRPKPSAARATSTKAAGTRKAPHNTHVASHGTSNRPAEASRDNTVETPSATTSSAPATTASQTIWPAPPPARAQAQPQVQPPASTAMNGAASAPRSGNFDSRWSAFR
jgi:murein L,D-transpeptidase YafK